MKRGIYNNRVLTRTRTTMSYSGEAVNICATIEEILKRETRMTISISGIALRFLSSMAGLRREIYVSKCIVLYVL